MAIRLHTALPGPKSRALLAKRQAEVATGPFHVTPIFVASAKGALLEDVDGNVLLDFAAGIGVNSVGHVAEAVLAAVQEQAGKLMHASFNVTPYEIYIDVARRLNAVTPGSFAKKTFLANSGAEAVENAIKIARAYTKRQAVVCFEHAFHGRTYMAMSLTGKAKPYKVGFGPFNPEVYRAPFPYAYRWRAGATTAQVAEECFQQFAQTVEAQITAKAVAAVILEPVLGEGGFIPVPKTFFQKLRDYCTEHGIVLIADEVQTGFGRTGKLFACEHFDIVPDIILTAKALAGGMPLSAVTGRAEIMDATPEGGIGGTYGGNPVACAAALAVLDTFEKTDLLNRAQEIGAQLQETLASWQKKYAIIGDVRGLGPMQAIELVKDTRTQEPHPEAAKKIVQLCYEKGLVVMTAGTYGNTVRLLMPLIISDQELSEGLGILEHAIKVVQG